MLRLSPSLVDIGSPLLFQRLSVSLSSLLPSNTYSLLEVCHAARPSTLHFLPIVLLVLPFLSLALTLETGIYGQTTTIF
jgi:hypothetical protein